MGSRNVRFAVRSACRHPATALAVVLTLALGIGFATAIWSAVDAVLFSPLPYREPDRLVMVWNELRSAGLKRLPLSAAQVLGLRESGAFVGVEAIWATRGTLLDDEPAQVSVGLVTPELFSLLGVSPAVGRLLAAGDEADPTAPPVLLGRRLWRERFGGDREVVGRRLRLDDRVATVVGVLPDDFRLLLPEDSGVPAELDVYQPLPWPLGEMAPESYFLRVVGRLRPGVSIEAARSQTVAAATRLRESFPTIAAGDAHLDVAGLRADAVQAIRPLLLAAAAAVVLFLVLTIGNVATLLVARTLRVRHELATRICLGASRGRLLGQQLTEIGLLTGTGAILGLVAGSVGGAALWRHRPPGVSRLESLGIDPMVVAAALGVAALATAVCAAIPLRLVSWDDPRRDLAGRDGAEGGRGRWLRPAVLAAQLALCTVLLVAAALLSRSSFALLRVDPGFQAEGLLTFKVALSTERFPADAERARLAREIEASLAALPGVAATGAGSHLPFDRWANWSETALAEGAAEEQGLHVDHRAITAGYFGAMGARILDGRDFDDRDSYDATPVAIVDEVLAGLAFPGSEAVGKRLRVAPFREGDFVPRWSTVVGVVAPVRDRSLARPSAGQVYLPFAQSPRWELTYAVRTGAEPTALAGEVRRAVTAVGHGLAVAELRPMTDYAAAATAVPRFMAGLIGLFAAVAVVLAAVGLYGVTAATVARRRRELALRLALGARGSDLVGQVLGEAVRLCAVALGVGLPAAWAASRLVASLLFGVGPSDPASYAAVAAFLTGATLLAALAPARRAAAISPATALRGE